MREPTNANPVPKPRGSPMLLILFSVVIIPAVMLGTTFGAGPAAILGGLIALFSLMAFMGGPLRPDLRLAATMAPLILFGAVVPRLLAEVSRPAAIVLVVLIVFFAALLPLRSARLVSAGNGLGMCTLFAYGFAPSGPAAPLQLVVATVSGLLVAVLIRTLFGITDPSKPTREKIADILVANEPALATAFSIWLSDGRQRWLGIILGAASRYRLAVHAATVSGNENNEATTSALESLRTRANLLAERLRSKPSRRGEMPDTPTQPENSNHGVLHSYAATALDTIEQAIHDRDSTPIARDNDRFSQFRDALLPPSARLRSIQVRHAVRTAFGLLLTLLVTVNLQPGDPLVATTLMTTFGILQASWRETFAKASPRIIGLVAGSVAVIVILLVVPPQFMTIIAGAALCIGLWNMISQPAMGYAFMVIVSIGFNASSPQLDPVGLLVEYAILTAVAVLIGLVIGFVVIPAFRPAPLRQRIVSAIESTMAVLRSAMDGRQPHDPDVLALHRTAAEKQQELVPDRERLDERQLDELDQLRVALRDLNVLVAIMPIERHTLQNALEALRPGVLASVQPIGNSPAASTELQSSALLGLAEQASNAEQHLLNTLPDQGGATR